MEENLDPECEPAQGFASEGTFPGLVGYAISWVTLNAILLLIASEDRSWGALAVAMLYGPIANGLLLLLGIVSFLRMKSEQRGRCGRIVGATLLFVVATGGDFVVILAMGIHGC